MSEDHLMHAVWNLKAIKYFELIELLNVLDLPAQKRFHNAAMVNEQSVPEGEYPTKDILEAVARGVSSLSERVTKLEDDLVGEKKKKNVRRGRRKK